VYVGACPSVIFQTSAAQHTMPLGIKLTLTQKRSYMLCRKKYAGPTRPSIQLFFLLILISFTFTSIGCSNGLGSSASQTAASSLTFQPQTVQFNDSNQRPTFETLTLTNVASTRESILSVIASPANLFGVSNWKGPVVLEPSQKIQIQLSFRPPAVGVYTGSLTIESQAGVRHGAPGDVTLLQSTRTAVVPLVGNNAQGSGTGTNITLTIAPTTLSIGAGESHTFTAVVSGTTDKAVTWSAILGSINSSGVYTAPAGINQVQDTVSATSVADGSIYASASVSVSAETTGGGCQNPSQPYSITNRPPATCPFYGNNPVALSPWPLPIDINTAPSEKAVNGDVVGQNAFLGAGQLSEAAAENYPFANWATPGSDDYGRTLYYAQPTDPYFNLNQSCEYTKNINGPAFRAPDQAPYSNTYRTDYGNGGADSDIRVFDPSSNVIAGGYTNWNSYTSNMLVGSSNAQSPMGTKMNVGSGCGLAKNIWTDQDWGSPNGWSNSQGAEGSANWAPMATVVRNDELMQGLVAHALTWLVSCDGHYTGSGGTYNDATHVFPANADTWICSSGTEPMPPNGALLYLDYTPAQIAAMNLPAWQKIFLSAASTYGGYFGVSSRQAAIAISGQEGTESGLAYQWQTGGTLSFPPDNGEKGFTISGGTPDPVFDYLASQGVPCNKGSGSSACKYPMNAWANIPALTGPSCPSTPCSVGQHWHMADPCVAAGLASGGAGNQGPVPTPCVGALYLTIQGAGTITSAPAGIRIVGIIGRISAANGTSVTLTAQPTTGHAFSDWSGACTGSGPCTVTLNGNHGTAVVTANFN
jgi:hypothetical protein